MTMHFVSEAHQERYETLSAQVQAGNDREFQSALYVLAAVGKNMQPFVSPGTIHFSKLMKAIKPWSSGEKALVKLAATLYNDTAWPVKIGDVFFSLDSANTKVALEGLRLRYQF